MSYDWTSAEGRAELRQRFQIDGGYVLGSLRITVGGESIEPAIEAAMGAAIPLLDALEAAEAREAKLRAALRGALDMEHDCCEQECPQCSFAAGIRDALALPHDSTALDALLAEARRAGAQACATAARTVFDATPSRCGADTSSSLLAAIERAAAEVEAAARKEPTP